MIISRFYVFVCSICNYGKEFVRRLELKWVDMVHLMLFNLTAFNVKKYYDLDTVIIPYVNDNWHALQLPPKVSDTGSLSTRNPGLIYFSLVRFSVYPNQKEERTFYQYWRIIGIDSSVAVKLRNVLRYGVCVFVCHLQHRVSRCLPLAPLQRIVYASDGKATNDYNSCLCQKMKKYSSTHTCPITRRSHHILML